MGLLNISRKKARIGPRRIHYQEPDGNDQKSCSARPQIAWLILKGETIVDARSVLPVREHDKIARTPLVAFFNITIRNFNDSR